MFNQQSLMSSYRSSLLLYQVVIFLVVVVNQPILRGLSVGLTIFLKKTMLYQLLLSLGSRSFLPLPWISLSIHDDSLCLGNHSMIASSYLCSSHLSNSYSYSFSLGRHDHNLSTNIDSIIISQNTRDHQLGAIANSIDR